MKDLVTFLAISIMLLFVVVLDAFSGSTETTQRELELSKMQLEFHVAVEREAVVSEGIAFEVESLVPCPGVCAIQLQREQLDKGGLNRRLKVIVDRPADKSGDITVICPADGCSRRTTWTEKTSSMQIMVVLDTALTSGTYEIRRLVKGSDEIARGFFTLHLYQDAYVPEKASISRCGKSGQIVEGQKIKRSARYPSIFSFLSFLFSRKYCASGNLANTLSLCIKDPRGSINCADDNILKFYVKRKGEYWIHYWNKAQLVHRTRFRGV